MPVLNRKQFKQHWNKVHPGLGNDGSGLWCYEDESNKKCRWFVSIKPINLQTENRKQQYRQWCRKIVKERSCVSQVQTLKIGGDSPTNQILHGGG